MYGFNEFAFRRFQVVADLKQVARRAQGEGFARIAQAVPGASHSADRLQQALDEMVAGDARIPARVADDLHPCLLLVAAQPREDASTFEAATALLLADRVQRGSGTDTLEWHWDAFAGNYRAAEAPVRAALIQGFSACLDMGLVKLADPPEGAALRTQEVGTVKAGLLRLARRMTRDEIRAVSLADGGADAERHRAALEDVLGPLGGIFPEGGYPFAVADAVSQDPSATGYLSCLALVCLNALDRGDANDAVSARWERQAPILVSRMGTGAVPVMMAVRHLYETDRDWNPYAGWQTDRIKVVPVAIPWIAPLS